MGVTWNVQDVVNKTIFMIGIFIIATAARGEWLMLIVYVGKDYFREMLYKTDANLNTTLHLPGDGVLQRLGLQDIHLYVVMATTTSFMSFWGIGFFFDNYFYKNRKHVPGDWKCQPDRWLTASNERHEFILGSTNMLIGSVASGFISCFIMNGGKNALYVNISDYGWLYFLCSIPALFLYNEAVSYYPHRLFHNPWLYKNVHKIHHRYGSPTIYSTTAMHPAEFCMYQTMLAIPAFTVPLHVGVFLSILIYGYYYGMMDHSGIKMDAMWPWQPSSMFHDNHHRYFHCNFGFNTVWLDRLHGTLRKKNYKYGEKVFGGRGKSLDGQTDINASPYYAY